MSGFNEAWDAVATSRNGEPVSQALRPLLQGVYSQSLSKPLDEVELKKSLENLLTFLSGDGRTNANCWAVDLFFCVGEGWERDWAEQTSISPRFKLPYCGRMGKLYISTRPGLTITAFRANCGRIMTRTG
jgi:hypothetical protein